MFLYRSTALLHGSDFAADQDNTVVPGTKYFQLSTAQLSASAVWNDAETES